MRIIRSQVPAGLPFSAVPSAVLRQVIADLPVANVPANMAGEQRRPSLGAIF
jgi:hypothetical protein